MNHDSFLIRVQQEIFNNNNNNTQIGEFNFESRIVLHLQFCATQFIHSEKAASFSLNMKSLTRDFMSSCIDFASQMVIEMFNLNSVARVIRNRYAIPIPHCSPHRWVLKVIIWRRNDYYLECHRHDDCFYFSRDPGICYTRSAKCIVYKYEHDVPQPAKVQRKINTFY